MNLIGWYKNKKHLATSIWETFRAGYPAKRLTVIGVTGTDGKTTVVHLIYEILKQAGYPTAAVSSLGAFVKPPVPEGEEFQDTGFHTTTPDATVLQPFLARLVNRSLTHVVLEVTSHGLDQHRVLGCNFKMGVLTNITHEHLDYHKTFEKYRAAKAKLLKHVMFAVLNWDDPSFEYVRAKTNPNARVITYGLKKGSTLLASGITTKGVSTTFTVHERGKKYKVATKLTGRYNISNILAAVGAARSLSIGWETVREAIAEFGGIPGRMEVIHTNPRVIVDFAHTPNSLQKLLETLLSSFARSHLAKQGRLITILGCAGERDVAKRPLMGEISARLTDISIFTADDPRSEDVNKIIDQMVGGARRAGATETLGANLVHSRSGSIPAHREKHKKKHTFIREPDRRKAIRLAISMAKKDDTVVLCGKGHEKSMALGKTEIPWSDQEEARAALKNKRTKQVV